MFLLKDVDELFSRFSEKAYAANVLDKKTKELIAVACSVMADCVPCINHHYKEAVKAGANMEEIAEALGVSMSICAGSKRAKYSKVIGELENAQTTVL